MLTSNTAFRSNCRNFVESHYCVEEFTLAYDQLVRGRRQHLIVVLVDKLELGILPPELDNYLLRHTYIGAHNYAQDIEVIRENIRCAMPNIPIKQIKVSTTN